MIKKFTDFLKLTPNDPDESRRTKLLHTLMLGMSLLALLVVILSATAILLNFSKLEDVALLIYGCVAFIVMNGLIFLLSKWSAKTAAWVFLLIINLVLAASDTPDKVGNGSSMFVFAIPIATAALLLSPASSFVFAALSSAIVVVLGINGNFVPNYPTLVGFFVLALVSWLSAQGLQNALKELRATNANLDRLVQERTKELAKALSRERIEAGRSKAILESIADGVIVFDIHGKAIEINPAIVRLLELPFEQVHGTTIDELTRSKALDSRNRGILAGLLSSTGQQLTSYRVLWERKTLSVSSSQVFDTEGTRMGTVAVFRDFTREAEVEKMKNTFLAMVSHELRTPLNAILGYAEMLKETIYGPINEKQARTTERIMSNSRRLLDIVSDLLDQAQMEAGKLTIMARPFKPVELLDNVHGVMDKIAADKDLALTSGLDPELPEWLTGDQARLQQILINLINNSIKFTKTGSVHFRAYRRDKKRWALEVRDTGIGIPADEIALVFESFHQVDSTTSREHGGFGLGLSIVKQLANLMGGEVNVSSQLEKGSAFTVVLPMVVSRRRITK
ncbi:MAG: two-component system OmpR family phosphate regulon sensor histidine kinase PhoR [Anaerolineaceae bacterium]|nr:MAG: two-component system OmpR family phosphate regulon sensor histidine kinase PhoR [Anaerolineaceae bacterium]